jgi:hypothetical protein
MTNTDLHSILRDLYIIDPELQAHEAELIPLVKALLQNKQNPKPTQEFAQKLRMLLKERSAELARTQPGFAATLANFFQSKSAFAVLGAFVGVAIAGPTVFLALQNGVDLPMAPTSERDAENEGMFAYDVEETSPRAFGELAVSDIAANPAVSARPQSGGGGGDMDAKVSSLIYPPGPMYNFTYEYAGDPLTLPEGDTVNVLRRKPVALSASTAGLPELDIIDLGTFPGSTVMNVSLTQDRKNGYMVTLDLKEGSVSVNQNYERWDDPYAKCNGDQACYERLQLSVGDIPSDDVLIGIAKRFLDEHGVDLSLYGEPEVDHQWRISYDSMPSDGDRRGMVPDTLSVLYPLVIDGKPVYEQYGTKTGITVSVNVRHKATIGAWNILVHRYEESAYPAVQESAQVMDYLTNMNSGGDMRVMMVEDSVDQPKTEQATVKLGTPTMALARYYRTGAGGVMEQILVPSLVFPVMETVNAPDYFPSSTPVIVPLAEELLKEAGSNGQPTPLMY